MSSDGLVLRVEGLGKSYRIGEREPYKALRDVLTDIATAPYHAVRGTRRVKPAVDCDFAGGELSEEVFDPSRSVMASSQRTEDTAGAAGERRSGNTIHAAASGGRERPCRIQPCDAHDGKYHLPDHAHG